MALFQQHFPVAVPQRGVASVACAKLTHARTIVLKARSTRRTLRVRARSDLNDKSSDVVIVGAGPAGLAAATMLAKRGWEHITVLEKRPSLNYEEIDKSYVYKIDGRGKKYLQKYGLVEVLQAAGVDGTEIKFTRCKPDGSVSKSSFKDPSRFSTWLPRSTLLQVLHQGFEINSVSDKIKILHNTRCTDITPAEDSQSPLSVTIQDTSGKTEVLRPRLVIGCDGLGSVVRSSMVKVDPDPTKFEVVQLNSPSTGLRFKVMQLPPNPTVNTKDGPVQLLNQLWAVVAGVNAPPNQQVYLGLLPVKDPQRRRTANVITKPDHEFWNIKTGEELLTFLEKSFPQLNVREYITPEQAEGFAASPGGRFPAPCYVKHLQLLLGEAESAPAGMLLLGDAIHAFPPDMGQGVNSALEDVVVLEQALDECKDDLTKALPRFEELRADDARALATLMQFGAPYQYNQDRVNAALWGVNLGIRLVLSTLLPFAFNKPAVLLTIDDQLRYSQALSMATETTTRVQALGAVLGVAALWQLLSKLQ